jgi:HAD superfamily hydrolase (TIGR01490 family)
MTAAFFDMDRTLVRCNTGTLWIRYQRARGEMSRLRALRALGWIARYKLSVLDMEAVTALVTAEMAGVVEEELAAKCLSFTREQVLHQVPAEAHAALAGHRRRGHLVAILSSSSPYIAEPVAHHLGIEHVLCTRLCVRDGRFAGQHVRPACYGQGKVVWAERFARAQAIDLAASYFYTDSYSDLPMLERVGERRVVNPDRRLLRHARRLGWSIERW